MSEAYAVTQSSRAASPVPPPGEVMSPPSLEIQQGNLAEAAPESPRNEQGASGPTHALSRTSDAAQRVATIARLMWETHQALLEQARLPEDAEPHVFDYVGDRPEEAPGKIEFRRREVVVPKPSTLLHTELSRHKALHDERLDHEELGPCRNAISEAVQRRDKPAVRQPLQTIPDIRTREVPDVKGIPIYHRPR